MSEETKQLPPDVYVGEDGKLYVAADRFVLIDILENIEDLDSEFSKVISENYWELV